MKRLFVILPAIALLGGCSTFQGLKNDLSRGYDAVANTFTKAVDPVKEEKKKLPVYDGSCPPISVRPDLKHLVEFQDPAKTTDATRVSEATIENVKNTCRVEKESLVMQIDIELSGKTGPKARVKPTDKPSFAYPYFIAVLDEKGNILSKEIFAASVAYNANQNDIKQSETVFQNMPFPDSEAGKSYSVIIGFQLTEDQLAYNQKQAK
jgi:hypothetical protein